MSRAYAAMEAEARTMLARASVPEASREITRAADCRYGRQAYELTVPVTAGGHHAGGDGGARRDFHDKHRATYGHASADEPVQLVNLRVAALGRLAGLDLGRTRGRRREGRRRRLHARDVYFKETGLVRVDVLRRERLAPGVAGPGPSIIESMDTTVVVPPGWRCRADAGGFLVDTGGEGMMARSIPRPSRW